MKLAKILVFISLLTTFACSSDAAFTKEDGADDQPQNPDVDYCDIYGWYGDGVCDEFCKNTDSDCAVACLTVESCAPGELQVPNCDDPSNFNCREVTSDCGTIFCAEQVGCGIEDDSGVEFVEDCPEDYNLVAFCEEEPGSDDCFVIQGCQESKYCQRAESCRAIPTCPDGMREVESCPAANNCEQFTTCNTTITCLFDIDCDAVPTCDAGDTEVASPAECLQDIGCYQNHICGDTVTCSDTADPQHACSEPAMCPEGSVQVAECTGHCTVSQEACGERITCQFLGEDD